MTTLGIRIRQARLAAKLTQQEIADALGIKRVSVTQWEQDITSPDSKRIAPLSALLKVSPSWLLDATGAGPQILPSVSTVQPVQSVVPIGHARPVEMVSGRELVGASDFPIYAATEGGQGHMIVSFDPIEYVKRPSILEGVPHSYGLLVTGESMVPAYWPGDMALVHPRLPLTSNSDVVLYGSDPSTGEVSSMIKRVLTYSDTKLKLKQWKPENQFFENRADWPVIHRVVGTYKSRG